MIQEQLTLENIGHLILAGIASWQLTETLRHGSIFEKIRHYAAHDLIPWWALPLRALSCSFCTSHWSAMICLGLLFVPYGHFILWWLTIIRLSNILNDICKPFCRTPNQQNRKLLLDATPEELEIEYVRKTGNILPNVSR